MKAPEASRLTLADVEAAAQRITGRVRRTPLLEITALRRSPIERGTLVLKLENLQATGSFKARGAISKLATLSAGETARGIVTASGGNHGIAVAYAGWLARVPTTIFVPENVAPLKAKKIEDWGARLVVSGSVWDESNRAALELAARDRLTYFHPFADPAVIAGQGTIALEILADDPAIDTLVVAIGGGGLISGIAVAAKALKPALRIVGVEPEGAPTLHACLEAGRIVELDRITTAVPTMAARRTEPINFDLVRRHVAEIVLISDDDMRNAASWMWLELGLAVDLSGAAAIAALMTRKVAPGGSERVCALVCGAGADGIEPA